MSDIAQDIKNPSMSKKSVYEIITDKVIAMIEDKKTLPWKKPWAGGEAPYNYKSKRPYSGFNAMMLQFMYDDPRYLTMKAIKEMGGSVMKGSKGVPVIFWKWIYKDENGKKTNIESEAVEKIPFLRYYTVFNASCIEGIDFEPLTKGGDMTGVEKLEHCRAFVDNTGANWHESSGDRAYYRPSTDKIVMPEMASFDSPFYFYSTLFHELGHWTGHKDRMNRFPSGPVVFGDENYSKEELVAEMFACFACNEHGIADEVIDNSAAYIEGWLKALKNDPKLIISASSKAKKAFEFAMAFSESKEPALAA